MKYLFGRKFQVISAIAFLTVVSTPAWAKDNTQWVVPDPWFIYTVLTVTFVGAFGLLVVIRADLLGTSNWSLANALSEEVLLPSLNADNQPLMKPDKTGVEKPVIIPKLCASSSRAIAFIGMIVILLMYLGFGVFALYSFGKTGEMPESIDKVIKFLVAGLTLFAPYVVNKFATAFESLTPKKG